MQRRRRRRKTRQLYFRLIFLIVIVVVSFNLIRRTTAKYKSTGTSNANIDFAYYLVKEQSISQELKLQSILPRDEAYVYTFLVANYNETERTQTALEYTFKLKTTTNLPLQYSVHLDGQNTELITSITTDQDSDGTYFKNITIQGDELGFRQNEQKTYKLEVTFPKQYNRAEYEGIVEYIEITIDSKQKIS